MKFHKKIKRSISHERDGMGWSCGKGTEISPSNESLQCYGAKKSHTPEGDGQTPHSKEKKTEEKNNRGQMTTSQKTDKNRRHAQRSTN